MDPSLQNPFAVNALPFAPYSDSISALGQQCRRPSTFRPAIPIIPEVSTLVAHGESDMVYRTLYDQEGNPIQVMTPRGNHMAVPITLIPDTAPSPTSATQAAQQ